MEERIQWVQVTYAWGFLSVAALSVSSSSLETKLLTKAPKRKLVFVLFFREGLLVLYGRGL